MCLGVGEGVGKCWGRCGEVLGKCNLTNSEVAAKAAISDMITLHRPWRHGANLFYYDATSQ